MSPNVEPWVTSVGVAGVPSASLVAIIIILQSLDKQLASRGVEVSLQGGLALILIFDRVLDMARTVVNIFSDSCATVIVARSMGEEGFYESSTGSEVAATIATESADEARGE